MKKLLFILMLLPIGLMAQELPTYDKEDEMILHSPAPAILLVSDTTRKNGKVISNTVWVVPGFIKYRRDSISSSEFLLFEYLDIDKKKLDKKYVVWLSKEREPILIK